MEPVLYDIKDAARYLGVAPSTLRYWEREGLVRAGRNRGNDYRQYALHDLIDASEIAFYRRLGVPVRELLRSKEPEYAALDLANPARSEAELIAAVAAHPTLLNRPIVVTPRGALLCRPPERVLELLQGI